MKKIINKKIYNTDTAEKIAEYSNMNNSSDFNYFSEILYKTKKGQFFLAGNGGANSKYAKHGGNESWESSDIILLTEDETINWLEKYDFVNEIEKYFPNFLEEG